MAWLAGYTKRKKITIDNTYVDADLTDFPLLVKITSDANIGAVALSTGYDLRFTASDGTTLLKYDRETFSISGGAATGIFWVKVPTVAGSADTDIYLYYGDSGASDGNDANNTWDAGFKLVWHLPNGASLTANDSTATGNNGTVDGATATTGLINGGASFDGSNDYIAKASPTFIDDTAGTVSMWVKAASVTGERCIWSVSTDGTVDDEFFVEHRGDASDELELTILVSGGVNFDKKTAANQITDTTNWHHIVTTSNGSTMKMYVDGVEKSFVSGSGTNSGQWFNTATSADAFSVGILQRSTNVIPWHGLVDEVRVSSSARSAAWIKFEYRNIIESDNEIAFSAEDVLATDAVAFPRPWMAPLLNYRDEWWAQLPSMPASTPVQVDATTAAIELAGVSASVSVGTTIQSTTAAIEASGVAASLSVGTIIVAGTAELELAGLPASVSVGTSILATTAELEITGVSANVSVGIGIIAGTAEIELAGVSANISAGVSILATTAEVEIAGIAGSVSVGTSVVASTAEIELTGVAAAVSSGVSIVASTAEVEIAGLSANVSAGASIVAGAAAIEIAGVAAVVSVGTTVLASTAELEISGIAASVSVGTTIQATTAELEIGGIAASIAASTSIVAATAEIELAGLPANVSAGTNIATTTAAAELAGVPAAVSVGTTINATTAEIEIGGVSATVTGTTLVVATTASMELDGIPANVSVGVNIVATTAEIEISAIPASVSVGTIVAASAAEIVLHPFAASVIATTRIDATTAEITLAPISATVTLGGQGGIVIMIHQTLLL